ncbi:hypothetical protein PILCRDRAFT_10403 [Piloderma croceum F 1598]|uniref:Uncharacterized protein n=1 Tax=Piloderma croceum (strain F 1598) TaxID=765440 RepID=A0A0C3FI14_PILCF|nr:hypothetical protein PILCRDRAFT_10403 [Piloderma croceum F 1598]
MARGNQKRMAEVLRQWLEDRNRYPKETMNGEGKGGEDSGGGGQESIWGVFGERIRMRLPNHFSSRAPWLRQLEERGSPLGGADPNSAKSKSTSRYSPLAILPSPLQHHTPYRYLGRPTHGDAEPSRLPAGSMSKYWFKKAGWGA